MGTLLLAIFLLVFGLNIIVGLSLPTWILGVLAFAAGVVMLAERFGLRLKRK
jgi:hypothetical protein